MMCGTIVHLKSGVTIKVVSDGHNPEYHDLLAWMSIPEKSHCFPAMITELEGSTRIVKVDDVLYIEPSGNILNEEEHEDYGLADLHQKPWNPPEDFNEREYTINVFLSEALRR